MDASSFSGAHASMDLSALPTEAAVSCRGISAAEAGAWQAGAQQSIFA